jgi:hypothetical protein
MYARVPDSTEHDLRRSLRSNSVRVPSLSHVMPFPYQSHLSLTLSFFLSNATLRYVMLRLSARTVSWNRHWLGNLCYQTQP